MSVSFFHPKKLESGKKIKHHLISLQ